VSVTPDLRDPPVPGGDGFRIVAPADHPEEVPALAEAGADEVYVGVLPPSWSERYGDWDCISRRQGNIANLASIEQMQHVAEQAGAAGLKASLALNVRYTAGQVPEVADLAVAWEEAGGTAVILSSLGLLVRLQQLGSRLARHISILANVTNSQAVAFYREFGATRVILPRELTVAEMAAVASMQPDIEFEAMTLNEKCRFIDGLCGFYHGTTFPDDAASVFDYERSGRGGTPVVHSQDLCYAGHGCQVPFVDELGRAIPQPPRDDVNRPACAACDLMPLYEARVRLLKIGGRGLPTGLKLRAVSFLRRACELALDGSDVAEMRDHYERTFGRSCDGASCYYPSRVFAGD